MNKKPAGMTTIYTYKGQFFNEDSVISEKFIEYDWNDLEYLVWAGIVKKIVSMCKVDYDFSNEVFSNVCRVPNNVSHNIKFDPEEFMKIAGGIEIYHIDYQFSDKIEFGCHQNFIMTSIPRFIFLGST